MDVLIFSNPNPPYLEWCIESIKTHSPSSKIHIIDGKAKSDLVYDFVKIYHHCSTNPDYEVIRSFQRWIVMLEYCHKNNIGEFFSCDSDVLLFCDLDKEVPNLQIAGGTGTCFVRNVAVLNLFVQSIFEFYEKKKWRFYANHSNVSDMTVWDEFFEQRDTGIMFHLNRPMWDANMGLSQGLDMRNGHKVVFFENGIPIGTKENSQKVPLNNLHCWGESKPRMKEIWELSRSTVGTSEPKEFI